MEVKYLRTICGAKKVNHVRNNSVRQRCASKLGMTDKAELGVLLWFGHMERMAEKRITKRMCV